MEWKSIKQLEAVSVETYGMYVLGAYSDGAWAQGRLLKGYEVLDNLSIAIAVNDNGRVYATHYFGPIKAAPPPKPEEIPVYLTRIEALSVLINGGKIKPITDNFDKKYLCIMDGDLIDEKENNRAWQWLEIEKFILVEAPPKPKMPENLKELKRFISQEITDFRNNYHETGYEPGPFELLLCIDEKLKILLKEYSEKNEE
jgi:hypothetical protein